MRVRVVSYEDVNAWILGKFARKLHEELIKLGVECDIGKVVDPKADVNHHIIYLGYTANNRSSMDTLMITHVDSTRKLDILKEQMKFAKAGICMSNETAVNLAMSGVPAERLCYVTPAHDGVIKPKKYKVGITSKVQPDGCKREDMLPTLCEIISPEDFEFIIMGMGWEDIITTIEKRGFKVKYYPDFIYDEYVKLIPTLDYYLYFGQDEGSMGFIDAAAAGVETIVTPQGYHLDAPGGITYPFNTNDELREIFAVLAARRRTLIDSVSTWNWTDYAIKHLEIWQHLQGQKGLNSKYQDGVNSLLDEKKHRAFDYFKYRAELYTGPMKRFYHRVKKIKDFKTFRIKLGNWLKK